MKEIADGSVDSIICDPPFNIVEKIGEDIHLFRQAAKNKDSTISKESMSFDIGFDYFQKKYYLLVYLMVKYQQNHKEIY
jgi:hypothetical protein